MDQLTKQRVVITNIKGENITYYVLENLIGNSGDGVGCSFTSLGYFTGPRVGDEVILTRDPSKTPMWSYEILSSDEKLQRQKELLASARVVVKDIKNDLKKMWRARLCELRNK